MIRAFFALPLSESAEAELHHYARGLQAQLSRQPLRWIKPENFHITLAFLGDVPEQQLLKLQSIAQHVACNHSPDWLQFSRLAWLPSPHRPKVLVVEPEENGRLYNVQADLAQCLRKKGFAVDHRRFRPHISLARVKGRLSPVSLHEPLPPIDLPMDELVLFSSRLTPGGAIYTPLNIAPLL
jgi:2'-5' RNA ligase